MAGRTLAGPLGHYFPISLSNNTPSDPSSNRDAEIRDDVENLQGQSLKRERALSQQVGTSLAKRNKSHPSFGDDFASPVWHQMLFSLDLPPYNQDGGFLLKHCIAWITRRGYVDRVPFLVALVCSSPEEGAVSGTIWLKDPTGAIEATIQRSTAEFFPEFYNEGTVVILRDIPVFNPTRFDHCLCISPDNVVKTVTKPQQMPQRGSPVDPNSSYLDIYESDPQPLREAKEAIMKKLSHSFTNPPNRTNPPTQANIRNPAYLPPPSSQQVPYSNPHHGNLNGNGAYQLSNNVNSRSEKSSNNQPRNRISYTQAQSKVNSPRNLRDGDLFLQYENASNNHNYQKDNNHNINNSRNDRGNHPTSFPAVNHHRNNLGIQSDYNNNNNNNNSYSKDAQNHRNNWENQGNSAVRLERASLTATQPLTNQYAATTQDFINQYGSSARNGDGETEEDIEALLSAFSPE